MESFPGVERVFPILKPYKLASREFKPENTVVNVDGFEIGGSSYSDYCRTLRSR